MTKPDETPELVPTHPDDSECVAYLDAECEAGERELLRAHFDGCWGCRTRLAAIEGSIARFVRARQAVAPGSLPPGEAPLAMFRLRLQRQSAEQAGGTSGALRVIWRDYERRFRRALSIPPPRWAVAIVVCLLACAVVTAQESLLQGLRSLARAVASLLEPPRPALAVRAKPRGESPAASLPFASATLAPRRRPLPLSYANSRATAQEVAVAETLHRLNACLGEEINTFQMSDGSLLVQGLVDSTARARELEGALSGLGGLQVQIYTPDTVNKGAELYDPPSENAQPPLPKSRQGVRVIDLSNAQMPMYERVREHFTRRSDVNVAEEAVQRLIVGFADEMVSRSREGVFHALALGKLRKQFSSSRTVRLPRASLDTVEWLCGEHRRSAAQASRRLREMLRGLDLSSGTLTPIDPPPSLASGDTERQLREAIERDALVRRLFTVSASGADPNKDLASLLALFDTGS